MKHFIRTIVSAGTLFMFFLLVPAITNAQVADPGDDPDLPIDGGVSLLVAAGVGYGIKKYRDERKKKSEVGL